MRTPMLSIAASLVLAGTCVADTLDVCPSGCSYSSIQAAIDAASNGDTIQIAAGTYYEYEINPSGKAITISGEANKKDGSPASVDSRKAPQSSILRPMGIPTLRRSS